jgi:hypothetical protein
LLLGALYVVSFLLYLRFKVSHLSENLFLKSLDLLCQFLLEGARVHPLCDHLALFFLLMQLFQFFDLLRFELEEVGLLENCLLLSFCAFFKFSNLFFQF